MVRTFTKENARSIAVLTLPLHKAKDEKVTAARLDLYTLRQEFWLQAQAEFRHSATQEQRRVTCFIGSPVRASHAYLGYTLYA